MTDYLLKNGNKPFDLRKCKLCGAKKRKTGELCRAKAMENGRCRIHGGLSTGAKTQGGIERRNKANYKHGLSSKKIFFANEIVREARMFRKRLIADYSDKN